MMPAGAIFWARGVIRRRPWRCDEEGRPFRVMKKESEMKRQAGAGRLCAYWFMGWIERRKEGSIEGGIEGRLSSLTSGPSLPE